MTVTDAVATSPAAEQPPVTPPQAPPRQPHQDTLGEKLLLKLLGIQVPSTLKPLTDDQKNSVRACVQPGDILLEGTATSFGWQIAEHAFNTGKWSHAAVYMGNDTFVDASGDFVAEHKLDEMLDEARHVAVYRPQYKTTQDRESALAYVRGAVGRPYDDAFDTATDKELYCSELPFWALKGMPNPIDVKVDAFAGIHMIVPDAFSHSPEIDRVYTTGRDSFWIDMASHWPVAASGVACAALGGHVGGVPGAVIGGVVGLVGATIIGNKIAGNS